MQPTDLPDATTKIHPSIWGALGAAIWSGGQVIVAVVKNKPSDKKTTVSEKLDRLLDDISSVKQMMATREDVKDLHEKIDGHIRAHAEGIFNRRVGDQ